MLTTAIAQASFAILFLKICLLLREALLREKMFSFGHCPNYLSPPSPQFGQLVPLFLDVKNDVLARITEPSNDDYDNGVSDNCDSNFGTFDDFGVKNDKKYHIT